MHGRAKRQVRKIAKWDIGNFVAQYLCCVYGDIDLIWYTTYIICLIFEQHLND